MKDRTLRAAAGASLGLAMTLRSASRIPVFDVFAETSEPWLVTSLPPWWWLLVGLGVGGLVGLVFPRSSAALFFFIGLSAAAVFVPGVFDVAPFLAAFSGRFLDFVLVSAALTLGWRWLRLPRGASANRMGVLAGCVFVAVGFKMWGDVGLSGDEPHYLLMTHSVLEDGDLAVENNYLAGDYQQFYSGKIGPHLAARTPYSVHGIGLPLLLVPGYAVAGMAGVVVTLALLGAVIVRSIFITGRHLGVSNEGAALAAGVFALTSPALFLCVSAYPELPAAVVVMLVAVRLVDPAGSSRHRTLALALGVGALPFLHMKFIPLAALLWLALALRLPSRRDRAAIAMGAVFAALALMSFFYYTTGSLDPTSSYGRQRIFLSGVPMGLLGLMFDQEYGLLVYAPVYLAGLAGLVVLVRRHPSIGLVAVGVIGAVAIPGAAHPLWSGGSSPPARFLFPALPLLALGVGSLWSWEKKWGIGPWLPALVAVSVSIAGFTVLLPGQPLYLNARDGTGRLWEVLSTSWDLTAYLPSIIRGDARSIAWALIAAGVVAAALVLQYRRRVGWLPSIVVVLLAAAWVQDLTGVVQPRTQEGRWVTGFMQRVAERGSSRFLGLPAFERLDTGAVFERVPLRLDPLRPDGDASHWWSVAYAIPSGRYRIAGVATEGWSPCHERNCFDVAARRFDSRVALSRFRVRASRLDDPPPRLYFEDLATSAPVALRSLPLPGGRRLHGLDDDAYLDAKGFWVKQGARAELALEPGGELELANGGRANTVVVQTASGMERVELAPWARTTVSLPSDDGISVFSIESESGFRPMDVDPDSRDHRELGVFVAAPAFDLRR